MRRRVLAGVVTVAVLAGAVVLGAILLRPPPSAADGQPGPPATATVSRQTLVDVVTAPATLGYGPEQAVISRLTGTVTALPAVGAIVTRGQALYRVDDEPVVLLYGPLPAYRKLALGVTGADVRELETNLRALGYLGFDVDDHFTASTAAAVRQWQHDLGLPGTGAVDLGRVYYGAGPARVAELKVTNGVPAAGPILTYTSTTRLVTAALPQHNQALAKIGAAVTVDLPTGQKAPGRITAVGPTPADEQAQGSEPTLAVVVAPDDPTGVDGLDDGPARVEFIAERRESVLVVPVGALLALAEGGYGLQVVDGAKTRIVAVTTGLFADGQVEVSGPGIEAALGVGVAQ